MHRPPIPRNSSTSPMYVETSTAATLKDLRYVVLAGMRKHSACFGLSTLPVCDPHGTGELVCSSTRRLRSTDALVAGDKCGTAARDPHGLPSSVNFQTSTAKFVVMVNCMHLAHLGTVCSVLSCERPRLSLLSEVRPAPPTPRDPRGVGVRGGAPRGA